LSRRRTHSQRPIDATAGPVNLTHHQRHHSDNPHSSAMPAACRFMTAQHLHQHVPHPAHHFGDHPVGSGGAGGPACPSFSNCFVTTSSSTNPAAPSSGPCPHAHSFCPQVTNAQVYFPNAGASAHVAAGGHSATPSSSSYHLLPPPLLHTAPLTGAAGHLFPSFYGPPPAAHSQVPYQTFPVTPQQQSRMYPVSHQLIRDQQHRVAELQRQAFAHHTR
jgi:hypothetical protein